jgi:hypothetical protein
MSETTTLKAFYGIFRGNASFFVKHQAPFTSNEGKLKAAWCGFAVYNKRNPAPKNKEEGDLIPTTIEHYRDHLNGKDGLAISPLTNVEDGDGNVVKRNVCYFAAIDIDVYGVNFTWLVQKLYSFGFQFMAALSKSGGLHLYFFFREAEPGNKVIETLSKIVEVFGLNRLFVNAKGKSKVEIFPKQATFIPGETNANCLFLPFYNTADKDACKNKMLTAEGKLLGIMKALPVIETMFTSLKEINAVVSKLPYNDAPYCIQTILLTGALAENDGRNNFLFSAGIYLKKKYQEDFYSTFEEVNDCLEVPLEKGDVESIYNSITNKEKNYDGYKCKDLPCADYCDKKLCKLREFGVGRDKGNHNTGADYWGRLTRYDTGDGQEPYYRWEVQVPDRDKLDVVQLDSYKDLLNQTVVQQNCLRDLNWVPHRVIEKIWINSVLNGLVGIEERTIKVAKSADTTEMSMLRESFLRFLTHNQIQKNGQPYMVKLKQVYHADGGYYFTTHGILAFLQFEKYTLGRVNLREWLIRQGCIENAKLEYKIANGERKTIECWKMPETAELLAMGTFYEEVYEGDADIIQKNKPDAEDKEGKDGDAVRF